MTNQEFDYKKIATDNISHWVELKEACEWAYGKALEHFQKLKDGNYIGALEDKKFSGIYNALSPYTNKWPKILEAEKRLLKADSAHFDSEDIDALSLIVKEAKAIRKKFRKLKQDMKEEERFIRLNRGQVSFRHIDPDDVTRRLSDSE